MFFVNARAFIERENNGVTELIIQTRVKPGEPEVLELPGGRLELFEPILDGLYREVFEETGLKVVRVEDQDTRIDTIGINAEFEVECVKPFCVYQTVNGPIDSMGMYFVCTVTGDLTENGDNTEKVHWRPVDDIRKLMNQDPMLFSNVDRAGLMYYLKHRNSR
ncbi:NUDIX hydrolase [Paenibacillus sp. N3/727]|uniref:NUDIX hydrolase n=1 Tax=Paenibacillus sp. N3/727 TaxID=2925845 RepID=UPI001F53D21B|nr:NUDIX hydrolase [Paenibacillus sp. N3/727]UNK16896.1 NUDIX hydrolase [Paenibacillus sp. N3/727]